MLFRSRVIVNLINQIEEVVVKLHCIIVIITATTITTTTATTTTTITKNTISATVWSYDRSANNVTDDTIIGRCVMMMCIVHIDRRNFTYFRCLLSSKW